MKRKRRKGQQHTTVATHSGVCPLSIVDVVFPLRYDILAQQQVYDLYAEGMRNPSALARATRETLVFERIRIAHARFRAWGRMSSDLPQARIERQAARYHTGNIRKLVGLYKSIEDVGFNPDLGRFSFKRPVDDALTTEGHPAPPGELFLTNGQHRLAALWTMGHRELAPSWYCIKDVENLVVPEFTFGYILDGSLTEKEFCRFAQMRFPTGGACDSINELAQWAAKTGHRWMSTYIDLYWRRGT